MNFESRPDYRQHVINGLFDKFCSPDYPQHVGLSVVIITNFTMRENYGGKIIVLRMKI